MHSGFDTRRLILALAIVASLVGCSRASQGNDEAPEIEISLHLDPDPPLFGRPCELSVVVLDATGVGVEGARLEIKGDMTHAGMVPVVATAEEGDAGQYTTGFEWTMAGDWILTVQAELPDGRMARREYTVRVEIPGG
jgi:hypothetical protein